MASVSAAQVPEELSPPPLPQEEPSPPPLPQGESIPYQYRPENELPPDPIFSRILVESTGGVLGGAVMGLSGILSGAPALRDVKCRSGEVCLLPLLFVMVPAAFVGIPYGVEGFADGMSGRGELLPTMAGSVLGTGVGFLSGYATGSTLGWIVSLILWPITGAVVGYEISHAINLRSAKAAGPVPSASTGARMVPLLGATPQGGFFTGLSGSF